MTLATDQLDRLAIDTIRTLAIDGVQQANSGHPGAPMGVAPMAYALWTRHLRHAPTNPHWPEPRPVRAVRGPRVDAPVLAAPPDGVRREPRRPQVVPPVGLDHARPPRVRPDAGRRGDDRPARPGPRQRRRHGDRRAPARRRVQPPRPRHRRPPDLRDRQRRRPAGGRRVRGELARRPPAPGQADRPVRRQPDPARRADGLGVQRGRARAVRRLRLAHPAGRGRHRRRGDRRAIDAAEADDRPSIIAVRTHIGYGSPNKQDTQKAHGAPLGPDEVRLTKEAYGWDPDKTFYVPDEALALFRRAIDEGKDLVRRVGVARSTAYAAAFPAEAAELKRRLAGPAARRLGRRPARVRGRHRGRDAQREPGRDPGAGRAAARAVRRLGGPVGVEPDRRQGERPRPLRGRPRRAATCGSASASTAWARSPTASSTTAASSPTARRSSPSATTCAAPCGSPRCPTCT